MAELFYAVRQKSTGLYFDESYYNFTEKKKPVLVRHLATAKSRMWRILADDKYQSGKTPEEAAIEIVEIYVTQSDPTLIEILPTAFEKLSGLCVSFSKMGTDRRVKNAGSIVSTVDKMMLNEKTAAMRYMVVVEEDLTTEIEIKHVVKNYRRKDNIYLIGTIEDLTLFRLFPITSILTYDFDERRFLD